MAENVGIACWRAEEVEQRLRNVLTGGPARPQETHDVVLGDWFRAVDGLAHARVADVVLARTEHRPRVERQIRSRRYGDPTAPAGRRLTAVVKALAKRQLSPTARARLTRTVPWDSRAKRFGPAEVQALADAFVRAYPGTSAPHRLKASLASTDPAFRSRLREGRTVTLRPVDPG